MSNLSDYNKHKELVKKLPVEQIEKIRIPFDVFLQEVENLAVWAMEDIESLKTINYTRERVIHVQEIAGVCRHAQSLWKKDMNSRSEAYQLWKKEGEKGTILRNELLRRLRFVFQNNADKLKTLATINKGQSNADMIQDLSDLAAFGKDNLELIHPIVDSKQLDSAETLSDTLATVLAKANVDKIKHNITKTFRNKAFTILKLENDQLRNSGKFLFVNNEERLKGYLSTYWNNTNKKRIS